jgi:Ser/Thr protein kinase RdoA (MazF antagonist)
MADPTAAVTSRRPADGRDVTPDLDDLLEAHGLRGIAEEQMRHDGWSGAQLTRFTRDDGARFVIKRDSLARDWIARVTGDAPELREALLVAARPAMPGPVTLPHLGLARDGEDVVLLMPDLTGTLIAWEQPIDEGTLARVLDALAALHREPWHDQIPRSFPWTDRARRLTLLTPAAAAAYRADGLPFAQRFLDGWDAYARLSRPPARELIDRLTADPAPLLAALERLPSAGLHGDLKLGNVGLAADGSVPIIDWQMTLVAPVAVELGWFLVANVAGLPIPPDEVLERYRRAADLPDDESWSALWDLAVLTGLFLRGWRKGLDTDAGVVYPNGLAAAKDLAWWTSNAIAAGQRRL